MRTGTRLLPPLAAIAIIVASGYVHGVWSFRWSAAAQVRESAARMTRVPARFGDWTSIETPLDDRQLRIARIDSIVSRRYTNERTGQSVSIMLVSGRPGPISVHTPDVCYPGAGYLLAPGREKIAVDYGTGTPAEFWEIQVEKPSAAGSDAMAIDFGWFAGGAWTSPTVDARLKFAGYPVLYKMYVIRERKKTERAGAADPGIEFLRGFLPELQRALAGSPA